MRRQAPYMQWEQLILPPLWVRFCPSVQKYFVALATQLSYIMSCIYWHWLLVNLLSLISLTPEWLLKELGTLNWPLKLDVSKLMTAWPAIEVRTAQIDNRSIFFTPLLPKAPNAASKKGSSGTTIYPAKNKMCHIFAHIAGVALKKNVPLEKFMSLTPMETQNCRQNHG